jgi:hypothetical protein
MKQIESPAPVLAQDCRERPQTDRARAGVVNGGA